MEAVPHLFQVMVILDPMLSSLLQIRRAPGQVYLAIIYLISVDIAIIPAVVYPAARRRSKSWTFPVSEKTYGHFFPVPKHFAISPGRKLS
jgi:hypothetical protein